MQCPVCKTECGNADECPTCGFNQLHMEFLNRDDAKAWMEAEVMQYRQRYEYQLLKLSNRYLHFGFRQEWLDYYLQYGEECFSGLAPMGNMQIWALKAWLIDSNLLQKDLVKFSPNTWLQKIIVDNGTHSIISWSLIWLYLAKNSPLIKWYCTHIKPGTEFRRNDIEYLMGDKYSLHTRHDITTSLLDTFKQSPIGETLMQGMPLLKEKNDKSTQQFIRKGMDNVPPAILLYSLFLYCHDAGRHYVQKNDNALNTDKCSITIKELTAYPVAISKNATSPIAVWGMNRGELYKCVFELTEIYPEFITWENTLWGDQIVLSNELLFRLLFEKRFLSYMRKGHDLLNAEAGIESSGKYAFPNIIKPGAKVKHRIFGIGEIIEVCANSEKQEKHGEEYGIDDRNLFDEQKGTDNTYQALIIVRFMDGKERKFAYPMAFERGFLSLL